MSTISQSCGKCAFISTDSSLLPSLTQVLLHSFQLCSVSVPYVLPPHLEGVILFQRLSWCSFKDSLLLPSPLVKILVGKEGLYGWGLWFFILFSARDCLVLILNRNRRKGSLRCLRDSLVTGFSHVFLVRCSCCY